MGALVVLIGVRAALLLVQLAGPPQLPPAAAAPAVPKISRKVVDVPSILHANIFGQSAPTASVSDAPVTTMALTLTATTAYTDPPDPKRGFAVIGTTATDTRNYRVGATLPGGAMLHSVYKDRVLLDRGGAIEALLMPPRVGARPPPPPVAAAGPAPAGRVQQVMRENPTLLNQVMSRTLQLEGGKLKGMKVYPVGNGQAFTKLGLKSGDLVTAINGVQLNDQTKADEIFGSMSNAAEAQVTVLRNGTQQELHLNVAEIANEAERLAVQGPAIPGAGQPPGPESAR
jgi:general secretion pathway protein C